MAADGKFSPPKRDNLTQPIQMQLSMTKNLFLKFLLHCWKIYEISNMFKKKMALMPNALSKLETANDVVRKMSKKICFKTPFDSQHAKVFQTLLKPSAKHFHHIF